MPDWTNPLFLLLVLAVPPLIGWWLHRREGALRYPATGWLTELPGGRGRWARWIGAGGRACALLLLILGLAGPRWPDQHTRIPTEGIAIEMVLDVSGSMGESDFQWQGMSISRLDAVKRAFRLFVAGGETEDGVTFEGRPTDQVGLITFGTRPHSTCPLTLSHSILLQMLDEQKPFSVPGESETNIADALVLALQRLQKATTQRKVLILLSDGEHNVPQPPSGLKPRQVAQIAASFGIRIYTISAGSNTPPAGELATATSAAIRAEGLRTMKDMAHITRGYCFLAGDTESLLAVWREIDQLERAEIQSFHYRRYHEGYPWFGLSALFLWITIVGLEKTLWRKLP